MRYALLIFLFGSFIRLTVGAAPVEFELIQKDTRLPRSFFETRSVVIISSGDRSQWRDKAEQIHKQLIRMKTDPVLYINYQDLKAGVSVFRKFREMFAARKIEQALLFDLDAPLVQLAIIPLSETGEFDFNSNAWHHEASALNDLLLTLALQIKRLDVQDHSFLVPQLPEIVDDLQIFDGKAYLNYPSRLTRATLAVALFPKLTRDQISDTGRAIAYNQKIEELNSVIRDAFQTYPFPYEFVEDLPDEQLYNNRFQYVFRTLDSSGKVIKRLLNYEIEDSEADYVSMIPLPDGSRTMKTILADQRVYKCYIQQTARSDVHVGRYWDADTNLGTAVSNFLLHLQNNVQ